MKTGNSYYGVKYKINGHRVGNVFALSSEYHVTFERCYSENTLESVEAIDWKNVTVEQIRTDCPACPLPEGYAFTVKAIQYDMNTQSIKVIIKADKQYWGDVTPYQAQIESLTATVAEKNAQLTESEENLAAANAQLAELEATYDAN
jgi:peptidoglycan hydrolase CwlO-like protein